MKGRALILIFLFLSFIVPSAAETDQYHIEYTSDFDFTKPGSTPNFYSKGINCIYVPDIDTIDGASFMQADLKGTWLGSTENSDYALCRLYSDSAHTNYIGSGIIGFIKGYDDKYRVQLFIDDELDWGALSGAQTIWWSLKTGETLGSMGYQQAETSSGAGNQQIHFGYHVSGTTRYLSGGAVHTVKMIYDFTNEIEYFYNSTEGYFDYTIYRNASNPSKLYINNSNITLRNESAFQTTNWSTYDHNTEYPVWTTWVTTDNDDIVQLEINWSALMVGDGPGPEGQVWFSKNYYQFPESVQVIADLEDDSDFDKYQYFVGLEEWNGTGWQLLSTWTFLVSDTEQTFTWGELEFSQSFPTLIRSHIYGYNKYTDNTETIATSADATYTIMPGETTGQLWTDKSVYNVSEKVYIYFNTSFADNKVLVSFPHNFLIWDDSPANTINTKVLIPDIYEIGTWKIYLYEGGILTNQTSIQIVGGSKISCSWQYSDVPIGTPADFWYTSANSSAVITAWNGDGNQIYNSTTDIGTYQGSITTSGREPGIYLLSMLHNETYYNSSMEVVAYDSWVRFDSSEYQIGDTINIEYFLIDDGEAISLWDGDSHLVIRFTQTNNVISTGYSKSVPFSLTDGNEYGNVISTGYSKSVPFSLTDGNEYGMDIEFGVGTGAYATGVWDVFIEDKYGALGNAWDSARVSVDTTDSPADTSNEMISIFFSPEGVFMLFTVCLTMMGLVLAKHPAGGGAGAVVGVGFGVYFNVLPVWMLILTVITLVVLAGVSIAVYFKGK